MLPQSNDSYRICRGVVRSLTAILIIVGGGIDRVSGEDTDVEALVRQSFQSKGAVTVDAIVARDDMQRACSQPQSDVSSEVAAAIATEATKDVAYPDDGKFLGDWKRGEVIAQNGRGRQFTDDPAAESGGNCYACHQLAAAEVSFGTLGPSLHNYGKIRGSDQAVLKYTWGKLFDPHASRPCSIMPRFGRNGILTPQQLRDVMALLFDPTSPVNQ